MSTQNTDQPLSAGQIVAEAREAVPEVTVAQAKDELDQGQVGLLLDVREPAEWDKGHIPGAVLAPRGMLEWYADPTTPYAFFFQAEDGIRDLTVTGVQTCALPI